MKTGRSGIATWAVSSARVLGAVVPLACCFGGMLLACGESTPPAEHPQASAEVSSLRLYLKNETKGEASIQTAIESALTQAGFQIAGEKEADITGALRVQKTEKSSILTVVRNGQKVVNYSYVVTVQLSGGGSVIDVASTEFSGEANEVDNEKITELARALAGSSKLRRYATQRDRQQKAATAEVKEEEEERKANEDLAGKKAKREAEALAYVEADADGCRKPVALDSCKKLQVFVAKYPDGIHVVEAKAILSGATVKLDKLREDDAEWKKAGAGACVPGASKEDCVGVELYLQKYPAGLHQEEARQILQKSRGKE